MDYKKMMGYSDKKKVTKKQSKPKVNKILESVKEEFGYVNEGPSYEYKKPLKNIETNLKNFSIEVLDFYELLRGKGLDKESTYLLNNIYKKYIIGFNKEFKKFARKLM
jgi:hypothetical protein